MFFIENQQLKISIHPKGAELQGLYHKGHQLDYLWNGDAAFWGKHSPLLFPIVGTLKDNLYYYQGKAYSLPRHGFARDRVFEAESQAADSITFLLRSDESTRAVYPFDFELRVIYRLTAEGMSTTYQVKNPAAAAAGGGQPQGGGARQSQAAGGGQSKAGSGGGQSPLYFSVGGHPAFKVPVVPDTAYNDYYLEFDKAETLPRWPISKDGLIEREPQPLLRDTRTLSLTKDLFARDALVFKHPVSSGVALRSARTERGLRMDFPGFPYLGIWAAPNADFVCIEPWCGIADPVESDQQLVNKEGINRLEPGGVFEKTWTLTFF
jgi:galactose mutarotase-like enzyme